MHIRIRQGERKGVGEGGDGELNVIKGCGVRWSRATPWLGVASCDCTPKITLSGRRRAAVRRAGGGPWRGRPPLVQPNHGCRRDSNGGLWTSKASCHNHRLKQSFKTFPREKMAVICSDGWLDLHNDSQNPRRKTKGHQRCSCSADRTDEKLRLRYRTYKLLF